MTDDAKQIEEVAEEVAPRRDVVLNGEYRFKVDGKGRVSLPAKFRKVLSTQLVVARDLDNECLYVFETPDFEAWITKLFDSFVEKKHPTKRECRHIMLKLKSLAKDVEVDKTGRIMLPAIGNTGRFEIWDAKRYDEVIDDTDISMLLDLAE